MRKMGQIPPELVTRFGKRIENQEYMKMPKPVIVVDEALPPELIKKIDMGMLPTLYSNSNSTTIATKTVMGTIGPKARRSEDLKRSGPKTAIRKKRLRNVGASKEKRA